MKNIITLLFLTGLTISAYGQKQGNIWYFGNHAGLDFNDTPPTSLLDGQTDFPLPNQWNEGCASISDSSGSLLFYTNGMKIWNKLQQVMTNGNYLMGHSSSTESSIIVPQPNSQQYFYVFTTDASENGFQNGIRYSVVDMCLDNNNGDVIPDAKNILLVDSVAEKLNCIRHSNGLDYWIVTHKFNSDAFYSFRLTSTGVMDTIISHTGTPDVIGWGGQMVSYLNGQKLIYAMTTTFSYAKTLLLDFDPSTGIISNEQILSSGGCEWGVAVSPDDSKLYTCNICNGQMFQYDLNAGNLADIIASKTFMAQNPYWRHFQLGPDGKIYISKTAAGNNGSDYLSQIEYPNEFFPACNFIDSAIYLGGQHGSFGLPGFIDRYDYSNTTVQCHTGIQQPNNSHQLIEIYPIPAVGELNIQNNSSQPIQFSLYNSLGEKLFFKILSGKTNIIGLHVYPSGIYFYHLRDDMKLVKSGTIIKQ